MGDIGALHYKATQLIDYLHKPLVLGINIRQTRNEALIPAECIYMIIVITVHNDMISWSYGVKLQGRLL